MQDLIKVNKLNIVAKEWQGKRVVTLSEIDSIHNRPEGTAKRNFIANKAKLIEGEDYFQITKSQKYEFRTLEIPNRGLTLLTESGYLLLVKSFTDDLAWQVQRVLVNTYFKAKEISNSAFKEQLAEAKLNNSRARRASIYLKLADRVTVDTFKQVLYAKSAEALNGEMLLPLPELPERTYTAEEIGRMLGISGQMVGKLTNAHNLKTAQFGQWAWDKAKYSNKEVQTFRYFKTVADKLREILEVA